MARPSRKFVNSHSMSFRDHNVQKLVDEAPGAPQFVAVSNSTSQAAEPLASPIAIVIRLLIAEGQRHPDLVDFYFDNVVSRGLDAITRFIERGVRNGEFRRTAVNDLPHVVLAPMMLSIVWRIVFTKRDLDTDRLMETQVEMLLAWIKA